MLELSHDIVALGEGPVFIHSDLLRASLFLKPSRSRLETLQNQIQFLRDTFSGRPLWLPSFNYQFPKTHLFNVEQTPCELGPLPEYFRTDQAEWRTFDPIFSCTGSGPLPEQGKPTQKLIAFDDSSPFAQLTRQDGTLFFYGAGFHTATFIHYLEWLVRAPFRYQKMFTGTIQTGQETFPITYQLHVRPMTLELRYDWPRLLADLKLAGIARCCCGDAAIGLPAEKLKSYWLEKLTEDALYFLDPTTRFRVETKLQELGRPFVLSDFESPDTTSTEKDSSSDA